jgi:phage recombination protein Bet
MNDHSPRGIVATMAEQYGMVPQAFEQTIRKTVMPSNASPEEFAAFLMVASKYNLNPLTREIYAYPKPGGGIQMIVGIDGWCNILNSHPAFDGMDFIDTVDAKGNVSAITCRIFRKDRSHPIECTEYLAECFRPTPPWKQWPRRLLRHKAMGQAARYAFALATVVIDQDEYERYPAVTMPNPLTKPQPSLQSRLEQLAEDANKDIIRVTADVPHDPDTGEIDLSAGMPDPIKPDDLPSPYNTPENQPSTYDGIDDAPDEWLINPESSAYIKGAADAYKDVTEGRTPKGKCRSSVIIADPQMLANWRAGYESVTPLEASP